LGVSGFAPPGEPRAVAPGTVPMASLASWFRDALTGPANVGQPSVVWSDRGSQILLHVGRLQARTAGQMLVVAVDTESNEFGVAPLIVRFVLGDTGDASALVAATDVDVLGDPGVSARWGRLFRDVVWAALVRLAETKAGGAGTHPAGVAVSTEALHFALGPETSAGTTGGEPA